MLCLYLHTYKTCIAQNITLAVYTTLTASAFGFDTQTLPAPVAQSTQWRQRPFSAAYGAISFADLQHFLMKCKLGLCIDES